MNREAATADEAAGMKWWNALTEEQRAYCKLDSWMSSPDNELPH